MISAVVVNWNGRAYLARCLGALLAQQPCPDEVLLVDNGSDDGSLEFVRAEFAQVRILETGSNDGPGRARNLGVEAARHELCVVLDNDVVLEPGAIAALLAAAERAPQAAMLQVRSLCGDDPSRVHYDAADLHYLGTLVLHNWFRPLATASDPTGPVGAGIALGFLTRRSVYRALGGFDAYLFILYEDNEFSWRARSRGYEIRLVPHALAVHLGGTAGLSVRSADAVYSARRTFLHCRNRWLVLLACMHPWTLVLTLPAQLGYTLLYAAFAISRGNFGAVVRGNLAVLSGIGHAWRRRRSLAQMPRRVPDRALLTAAPMTANPGLADRGAKAWVRRASDRAFSIYWRIVRRIAC